MEADYREQFFNASDGLRLFFRRWFVPQAKGLVVVVHGFAEHSGRYQTLAKALSQAGWSVAAFDYRGHGQSGGRRAHVDRFDDYLDDVSSFLDAVKKDGFTGLPVLLGHSQGGLIGARLAELRDDRLSALALSSPFFGLAMKVPALKVWAGKALSGLLPTLAMKSGVDPAWLSHDRDIVEQYAADPLVSDVATSRWFTEILAAQEITLREARLVRCPLLVLQAGDDRVASREDTRKFYEAAGTSDKVFHLYDGYYHEIFNELGRGRVFQDLCSWLEDRRTSRRVRP